ncbi:MAG: sigma-70 family RNA polymerase sigma factor [Phycisphaerales bacterium]|nr:sigma-70 family RNA polymerase sigma factor [Phycisphaerales bacterium]
MEPSEQPAADVTRILRNWTSLDDPAGDLFPVVYTQLRSLAAGLMRSEDADHTLGATALVHEAFLKLMSTTERSGAMESARDRGYFFAAAAQAMRRVLVDHARAQAAERRGGGRTPIDLGRLPADIGELARDDSPDLVLAIDQALTVLESEDEEAAQIVRLRFFGGLTAKEAAHLLGVAERTVMRRWSFARARLFQILEAQA